MVRPGSRYHGGVQSWVALLAIASACGGSAAIRTTHRGASAPASQPGADAGVAAGTTSRPEVGCLQPSCAYHAGSNAYFTCLAGGNGTCLHYGAPCTPAGNCMVDAADRTYKQCVKPDSGTCLEWGPLCTPPSACMFRFEDGMYRHCDEPEAGTCKRYGALCAP